MPKNMIHESWCSNKPHLLHVTKYILSHSELFATFFAVHPDILFKIVFWLLSEMSDLVKVACLWSPCCSSHLPFHWSTGALWKVHHMIQEKLLPVLIKNLNPTCKPFSCPFSRSWSQGPFSAQLSQISPQRCIQHLLLQPCLPLWPSNRNTLEMVRIPGTNKIEQIVNKRLLRNWEAKSNLPWFPQWRLSFLCPVQTDESCNHIFTT